MNKKKAKSGIGADFKSEMNGLLDDLNKDKKQEEDDEVLAELKKIQEIDFEAGMDGDSKKRKSLNNNGIGSKLAKLQTKTAKIMAQQRKSQVDLSNMGKSGETPKRLSNKSGNLR